MGEIIAIASQKGGVGKTTTAVNFGASLAQLGYKTLLCDVDPQGSIATSFGYGRYDIRAGILEIFTKNVPVKECIHPTEMDLFHFVPSNIWSDEVDRKSLIGATNNSILKNALNDVVDMYDYIIIDCPPSLGNLTFNALIAANSMIVPIQCEYYALKALGRFLKMTRNLKIEHNPELKCRGCLLTMVDMRNNLSKRVINKVRYTLQGLVFETMIPRNIRLAEVPFYGKPAYLIDRSSKGAQSYLNLAKEVVEQSVKQKQQQNEVAEVVAA